MKLLVDCGHNNSDIFFLFSLNQVNHGSVNEINILYFMYTIY